MFRKNSAFSLVELLISITIIGLLATIILSSVSNSRARAYDSKIKQQLSSFRTAAEMYFSTNGNSYGPASSFCNGGIFNDFTPANGTPGVYIDPANMPSFTTIVCDSTNTAYAVKATLYSGNDYWCVDNKGASRVVSGTPESGTVCP